MVELLTSVIKMLFGTTISDNVGNWMSTLFDGVINILDAGVIANAMTIFSGVAMSLLTLYFFLELYNNVSREMFTIDRLIVSLTKLFVALAILICLPEFVLGIAKVGKASYDMIDKGNIFNIVSDAGDSDASDLMQCLQNIATNKDGAMDDFTEDLINNDWDGIWNFIRHIPLVLPLGIAGLIGLAAIAIGCLTCTGNAILILVYAVMSPIAVVNLFEEGSRSAGIRYLKKFAATCLTMALILVVLQALSALNGSIVAMALQGVTDPSTGTVITELTAENASTVFSFSNIAVLLVPELAAVTLMSGCGKLSAEILGA